MAWQVLAPFPSGCMWWTLEVAVSHPAGKMTAAASRGKRAVKHEHHHWHDAHLISSRHRWRYDDNSRWGFGGPVAITRRSLKEGAVNVSSAIRRNERTQCAQPRTVGCIALADNVLPVVGRGRGHACIMHGRLSFMRNFLCAIKKIAVPYMSLKKFSGL